MKELNELVEYEQPTKYIVKSDVYNNDYKTPVLTAGKTFILGYTNETDNIFDAKKEPVIIFDDFTTTIKYVDFPFKVKSSAMKILHAKPGVNIKYIYYSMLQLKVDTTVHKRYWISEFSKKKIKYRTLEEQNKIVKKYDLIEKAINLCNLKKINLEKLINSIFEENFSNIDKKELLKNITIMQRGETITKATAVPGTIPVIAGGQTPAYYHNEYNREGETITISGSGAYAGYVQYWDCPIFCSDSFSIKTKNENKIKTQFIYYYLKNNQQKIYLTKRGAGIPHVTISSIENFEIPVPNINKQLKFLDLVNKKDKAITLINSNLNMLNKLLLTYLNNDF